MSDRPLDESLNPIWVLLSKGESPNLWMPPPGGKDWASSLRSATAALGDGELIVSVGRPLARSALSRISGRGGLSSKGPSPSEVTEAFEKEGLEISASFGLWPSASFSSYCLSLGPHPHALLAPDFWCARRRRQPTLGTDAGQVGAVHATGRRYLTWYRIRSASI